MMYEVWMTQGQGGDKVAEFPSLQEALLHVGENEASGSFAIKYPDGQWHDWNTQYKL